jgi:hypothetical protein
MFNFRKPKEIKNDKWHNFLPEGFFMFGTTPNVKVGILKPCSYLHPITPEAKESLKGSCPICEEFRKAK